MLVDCHAHLASPEFDDDRDAVRARARSAGVGVVLVVGEHLADDRRVLDVAREPAAGGCELLACLGVHPDRFGDQRELPTTEEIEATMNLIRDNASSLAAVGEVGLDRWVARDHDRRAAQVSLLERMVALALELALPLNVHSRSAGKHALDVLKSAGARAVLMHAFDGKATHAARAADDGFLFSIPPSVVRSEQKQKLVRRLPLTALALESDSPVLGPVRNERNEPANVVHSLDFIARAHGVSRDRVEEVTTENARRLFPSIHSLTSVV